jgi:predicted ATPase
MQESIHIQNFGPLKSIRIDHVKPLTIFIGESASGKSTLLKVIALFRYLFKKVAVRSYLKHGNISKSPFRINFDTLLKENELRDYLQSDTLIEYTVHGKKQNYQIAFRNGKIEGTKNTIIAPEDLIYIKLSFLSETRSVVPAWAHRGARMPGVSLGFYFHETFNDFDEATDSVTDLKIDFMNLRYRSKKKGNTKEHYISSDNDKHKPIYLKSASSGIQTITPLLVVTEYFAHHFDFSLSFKKSVLNYLFESNHISDFKQDINISDIHNKVDIHIEEPELSLFPDTQVELLNALVRQAINTKKEDRQVGLMITTHSPYIINQINVLLRAAYRGTTIKGAALPAQAVEVYRVIDGTLQSLNSFDQNEELIINTIDLSETMNDIYQTYNELNKHGSTATH